MSRRRFRVKVGEKTFTVEVEEISEPMAPAVTSRGAAEPVAPRRRVQVAAPPKLVARPGEGVAEVVRAPLPGTVLKLACEKDQPVEKGQLLLVLEAMKMENEMYAPTSGVVSEILVSEGQHVEHGEELIRIS